MKNKVYDFELAVDWEMIRLISQIDRFDASWTSIEKKEKQNLKQLKSIATIKSVGASTRIEGSKMTDEEVEELIENIDISKIEDRDSQEVVGYFNVLDIISESYSDLSVNESTIKNFHNQLLKLSEKDKWHKGKYKQHSNAVEANFPDGSRQIIFETTPPGIETEDAISNLIKWNKEEKEVHPLIKCASFVYEFVSIHPFQDGNGRLSRLLTTLLLLKNGYNWIQYVSFEHEIENNKRNYYRVLRSCQAQRPNEEITEWILFFLNSLLNVQNKLSEKLKVSGIENQLNTRQKAIWKYVENHSGCKSGEIAKKLNIPNPTVKRLLAELVKKELILKNGKGAATNYLPVS